MDGTGYADRNHHVHNKAYNQRNDKQPGNRPGMGTDFPQRNIGEQLPAYRGGLEIYEIHFLPDVIFKGTHLAFLQNSAGILRQGKE